MNERAWFRFMLLAVVGFAASSVYADGILKTVALSGQPAPGTDSVYKSFSSPVINAAGDLAFSAEMSGGSVTLLSRYGIWSKTAAEDLSLLARSGDPVAGNGGGRVYSTFTRLVLNDQGRLAFSSGLAPPRGGIISDYGVWRGSSSSDLEMIAAFGQTVPGTIPPVGPDDGYGSLSLNNVGQIAFRSGLSGSFESGLWLENGTGALQLVVRSYTQAPGDPMGLLFSNGFAQNMLLNDNGQMVFEVNLTDGVSYQDKSAIYAASTLGSGGIQRIAGPLDQIVTDRGPVTILSAKSPQLSALEEIVFRAEYSSGLDVGTSIVAWKNGSYQTIVAQDDPVNAASLDKFEYLGAFWHDQFGDVIFNAGTTPSVSGGSKGGFFLRSTDGTISPIALIGKQAPGAPDGQVFYSFGDFFNRDPAMNGNGRVVFVGALQDATSGDLVGRGVWTWSKSGGLVPLILSGQYIDVNDGPATDLRKVVYTKWGGFGSNHDGLPIALNDRGQLALNVAFSDGSYGILIADTAAAPEPATCPLIVAAIATVLAAKPRSRRIHPVACNS